MELTNAIPAQSGIYKITNIINNKIYIGQSKNLYKRLKNYIYEASYYKNDKRLKRPIIFAIKKYGLKNFKFDVIELTIDLNEREKYWI
jgi:group I intron endonuclease